MNLIILGIRVLRVVDECGFVRKTYRQLDGFVCRSYMGVCAVLVIV